MLAIVQPTDIFKDNLALLPAIGAAERLDLLNEDGSVAGSIENMPGKQGSLAVYLYLKLAFGILDSVAAKHGLLIFAEHRVDAINRPGAHPNVDRLLDIAAGGAALRFKLVEA